MARYQVDEFLGIGQPVCFELAVEVDKKIDLLYDLCVLCRSKNKDGSDALEEATRKMLLDCPSLISIDNAVHGIIVGKYTLDQLLKTRGYLQ